MIKLEFQSKNGIKGNKVRFRKKRNTWIPRSSSILSDITSKTSESFPTKVSNLEFQFKQCAVLNKLDIRRLSCTSQLERSKRLFDYEVFFVNSLVGIPKPSIPGAKHTKPKILMNQKRKRSIGTTVEHRNTEYKDHYNPLEDTEPPSPLIKSRYL